MAQDVIGVLFGVQGGGDINGESGKRIVKDLTDIVTDINSGKSSIPKIRLEFDFGDVSSIITQLKTQLKEIQGVAKNIKIPDIGGVQKKQKGGTYSKLTSQVKQYYSELAKLQKIEMKSNDVSNTGGVWSISTQDSQYRNRIKLMNDLQTGYDKLFASVDKNGKRELKSAKELGITERQRLMLQGEIDQATRNNAIENEKSSAKIQDVWSKNSTKVHEYILRMREVASKNSDVKKMMDDLDKLATSGDPKNLDQLTEGMAKLQQKIRETGADVETWGQKMSKTFGSRVRSVLAAMGVGSITKYLRDVYQSVIALDKAVVNLQVATGKSREEVKQLVKSYSDLGKQLGVTTAEVADSADTWLRQGYSIEKANALIANSTMLSKLGQMGAADASKALTSSMKGYNVAVEDSIKIVDKFTAVDMVAAASAGDLATGMAETATSARIAGVSMDKLIGYIATVKEVTQDGSESVGTFYKTLFARMNNVAAGKFVDEETGESLNDVETTLNKLQISLRDSNGAFRNSGEVLDEVASRWASLDNVARHAIATAFAGTRQQEKFIVLMENYGSALEYAGVAAGSAGTAAEKYNAYLDSVEGKMNSMKASFEELSTSLLDSDLITGVLSGITWVIDKITILSDAIGGLKGVIYAAVSVVATLKADSILKLFNLLPKLITIIKTELIAVKSSGLTAGQALSSMFSKITAGATTAQLAVGALAAVLGVALLVYNNHNRKVQESVSNYLASASAASEEVSSIQNNAKSLKELVAEYKNLAMANNGAFDGSAASQVQTIQDKITGLVGDQAKNLDLVNGKLDDELTKLKDITLEQKEAAKAKAIEAMADVRNAYREQMDGSWAPKTYLVAGATKTFWGLQDNSVEAESTINAYKDKYQVDIQKLRPSNAGAVQTHLWGLQYDYDSIDDFMSQYEKVSAMKTQLAIDGLEGSSLYDATNAFISDFKSLYENYSSAKKTLDLLEESANNSASAVSSTVISLKSAYDILKATQDGYDGISEALSSITAEGYLTADALSTLFKLEDDNALAGLKLSDILERDAMGYKIAGDALQQYVDVLIDTYKAEYMTARLSGSQSNIDNAISNLRTLQAVLATLSQTQDDYSDSCEAYRDELEKQKDAYDGQLDRFKELIDLRKELLDTYQEELNYQRELEKRQQKVSNLQTQLAVARLDNSAAGRARVRELESDLRDAQESLDDFTLEHAIDILSKQLDNEYSEYEAFIKSKLDAITSILEGLDTSPDVNIINDTSWIPGVIDKITDIISGSGSGIDTPYRDVVDPGTYSQFERYIDEKKKTQFKLAAYHSGGIVGGVSSIGANEEFAKLLKGEFVSTPAQMRRFMEDTLPAISGYKGLSESNEFNAPLIEVKCDSVTKDALPELERLVNEAAKVIQKQLDSGMSRTGFKRTAKNLLI